MMFQGVPNELIRFLKMPRSISESHVTCMQTVHMCAALALLVPVFFHWYAPREDDEEYAMDWASAGLSWQAKLQLVAFCVFEVSAACVHTSLASQGFRYLDAFC